MEAIDFTPIHKLFDTKKKILITSHSNPDGDAIGSALALYHFLTAAGHDVHVMVPDRFPDFLAWLSGSEKVLIYNDSKAVCDRLFTASDILFALDYNAPNRIGDASTAFVQAEGVKILIDHHIDPAYDAYNHCFTTTQVSSTSELVFRFMQSFSDDLINRDIAEGIYVGIMTDTGSFSYNCNYPSTFEIAASLIAKGIDTSRLSRLVYSNNAESRLRLLGYALSEKLIVVPEYHTAYITLTSDELNKYNYQTGDTEGLVNYALSIKGIRFAALFTERENKIRISFRSVGEFSVNEFARKYFQGGGHRNAAGGDSFIDMNQTILRFNRLLENHRDDLT